MSKVLRGMLVAGLAVGALGLGTTVNAETGGTITRTAGNVEEFQTTFAWGGGNSETQLQDIVNNLELTGVDILALKNNTNYQVKLTDGNEIKAVMIEGADLDHYLNDTGNQTNGLFSSVLVSRTDNEGKNTVTITTPSKITEVTEKGYEQPLLTAGVSNLDVKVSTMGDWNGNGVNGRSALAGVYKALAANGIEVDPDRAALAQDEVNAVADITKEGDNAEVKDLDAKLTSALAEIKVGLAEIKEKQEGQLTKQDVEDVVNKVLDARGLDNLLSKEDVAKLVALAEQYDKTEGVLDAESVEKYKAYARDTLKGLGEKAMEVKDYLGTEEGQGVLAKIGEFFSGLWESFMGLFK